MKSATMLCCIFCAVVISPERAQTQTSTGERTVWVRKEPVKRVVAYRRFHPSGVQSPIFIHDLEVKGQKRKLPVIGGTKESASRKVEADEEFDEDDNTFVEHIRFKVTNRSGKAIKFIRFIIHFYTSEGLIRGGFDAALWVEYGYTPMPKGSPSETPLMPGKTATISTDSVPESALVRLREDLVKLNADIVRAGIVINTVTFEDGSKWYYDGQTQ